MTFRERLAKAREEQHELYAFCEEAFEAMVDAEEENDAEMARGFRISIENAQNRIAEIEKGLLLG